MSEGDKLIRLIRWATLLVGGGWVLSVVGPYLLVILYAL